MASAVGTFGKIRLPLTRMKTRMRGSSLDEESSSDDNDESKEDGKVAAATAATFPCKFIRVLHVMLELF